MKTRRATKAEMAARVERVRELAAQGMSQLTIADVLGVNQGTLSALMAKHGIYDLRQHLDEVLMPVLRKWDVFGRDDFGPEGEKTREELAAFLEQLERDTVKFEEMRDRSLAREALKKARQEKKAS